MELTEDKEKTGVTRLVCLCVRVRACMCVCGGGGGFRVSPRALQSQYIRTYVCTVGSFKVQGVCVHVRQKAEYGLLCIS